MQSNLEITQTIEFDKYGRMKYHPDFHENHRKPFSESELEYVCKYWEMDSNRSIAFAIGKTEKTIAQKVSQLKKNGKFEYYKSLNKNW